MSKFSGAYLLLALTFTAEATTFHVSAAELTDIHPRQQTRTIGEAAALAKAGDRIVVHGGTYRESVKIEQSGTEAAPIALVAAPGAWVTVTGADRIRDWRRESASEHVYSTTWPHAFISWNKNHTHPDDDFHLVIGRCEQVFVNNYPLRQVLQRDKLSRGSFFADLDNKRLYAWSGDNLDLSDSGVMAEASVRGDILLSAGNHVHIKGIRFRYAGNRAQHGAVEIRGDDNLVEDCVFEHTNSSGALFTGKRATVRNCTFQYNGQLGFSASRAHGLHMTGCTVRNNNVKGFNRGWEAGGNKICLTRGAVIESSTFVDNRGDGIWFDIGNEDCVVRNCLIAWNESAGVFYEISYGLHAHDNVIVGNGFAYNPAGWGSSSGISISSSPNCIIERNILAGNKEGVNFREQQRSTPRIGGGSEPVWNHDQIIRNNIIAWNRDAQVWGWFDVDDQRHWPEVMQEWPEDEKGKEHLTLQDLNIRFTGNLYAPGPGRGLFNWGVTWKKHRKYDTLDKLRAGLDLDKDGKVIEFSVKDFSGLDLRVPSGCETIESGCYPRGDVPGVRLGLIK